MDCKGGRGLIKQQPGTGEEISAGQSRVEGRLPPGKILGGSISCEERELIGHSVTSRTLRTRPEMELSIRKRGRGGRERDQCRKRKKGLVLVGLGARLGEWPVGGASRSFCGRQRREKKKKKTIYEKGEIS